MSNYNNLKTAIQQVIKQNGKQEITGDILQSTLLAMVNSIGKNYQYVGIATPELDPGSPDQNVMYITSQNGVYANFNNLQVENEIAVLTFNGEWAKQTIYSLETVNDVKSRASQTYENLEAIQNSNDKNVNKIYIDKETNTSYRYDSASDSYVNIGATLKKEEVAEMCFRELFINVGGKYENGKYSYFGIELTYDEAKTAYNYPIISYRELSNYNYPARRDGYAFSCKVLISKLPAFGAGWTQSRSFEGIRSENLILHNVDEIININNTAVRVFYSEYIKNIYNILDFRNRTSDINKYFWGSLLEDVKIKNIKVNLDISVCVKLYYKSIKYIVDNASNTSAITITVHPTTYGYLTGTIQPTEQVGGTTEEWQAIVTTATEKQITFATTE